MSSRKWAARRTYRRSHLFGTGSEVTPFAVITDEATGTKYPLADYQLLPNMAIIDTRSDDVPASWADLCVRYRML